MNLNQSHDHAGNKGCASCWNQPLCDLYDGSPMCNTFVLRAPQRYDDMLSINTGHGTYTEKRTCPIQWYILTCTLINPEAWTQSIATVMTSRQQGKATEKVLQQPRDTWIPFAYRNIDWYALGNQPWRPVIVRIWDLCALFFGTCFVEVVSVYIRVSLPVSVSVCIHICKLHTYARTYVVDGYVQYRYDACM